MTLDTRIAFNVDRFDDVKMAWKCPHLTTRTAGPGDEEVRTGTVVRLDGEAHKTRRRVMGQLLSRGGHKYFRDTYLFPTADAALAEVLRHPDEDGVVRFEVRSWARRVNQQLAAALVGFDDATSPEGADELFSLVERFIKGYQGVFDNAFTPYEADGEMQRACLAARDEMIARFYTPSLNRRRELLADGTEPSDLPSDLMSLIAKQSDPAWKDDRLAQREALFLLAAGVHTTSNSLVWTLAELFEYFERFPEERKNRTDEEFLFGAASEALRLHPVTAGFVRRAEIDVELPSGAVIPEGAIAVLQNGPAARDEALYGDDANEFNPYRQLEKGVPRIGFAFGAGPHMCLGMPIVMGAEGNDGSLMYLLRQLMNAGVEREATSPKIPLGSENGQFNPAAKSLPLYVTCSVG
jgi:cytochrome P450